jgi:hypothetical protein
VVIKAPGAYALTGSVAFNGIGAPPECLDPISGAAVTGILIEANGVSLDLSGFSVGLSAAAALQVREFTCVRVAGDDAVVTNGVIGRASAFGVVASDVRNLTVDSLSVRDFEYGGISIEGCTDLAVADCLVGPNFQGRRPDGDLSLAARYLPTLDGLPAGAQLAVALGAAATSGPFRSDLGACVGVSVAGCLGLVGLADISVTSLVQRPVQVPFLAFPGEPFPQGALGDPIPAAGASPERMAAQEAAVQAGRLPPPEEVPACPVAAAHPCATYATNFGVCSSCTISRPARPAKPTLRLGLDAQARQVLGAVGVRLDTLVDYSLTNIQVSTLQATLGQPSKASSGICPTALTSGTRARAPTTELLLLGCRNGFAAGIPEPLLVQSERPAGAPCTLPCGFSAAWMASGSSQLSARPVGNPQNAQLVPTFLPPFPCPPP